MKTSKLLRRLTSLAIALWMVSGSVAVPLLCRPFYYAHIVPLNLPQETGLSVAEIRLAYDRVMDFCLGLRPDFSAGILPWSEAGRAHFEDVRGLFLLDLWVLGLSSAVLALVFFVTRAKKIRPLGRHTSGFWAAVTVGGGFALTGAAAALDFSRAFTVFHQIFFPGKDNWVFDPAADPVIQILPEVFFRNCAILILSVLLLFCAVLLLADWRRNKKLRKACGGRAGCIGYIPPSDCVRKA